MPIRHYVFTDKGPFTLLNWIDYSFFIIYVVLYLLIVAHYKFMMYYYDIDPIFPLGVRLEYMFMYWILSWIFTLSLFHVLGYIELTFISRSDSFVILIGSLLSMIIITTVLILYKLGYMDV